MVSNIYGSIMNAKAIPAAKLKFGRSLMIDKIKRITYGPFDGKCRNPKQKNNPERHSSQELECHPKYKLFQYLKKNGLTLPDFRGEWIA